MPDKKSIYTIHMNEILQISPTLYKSCLLHSTTFLF